MTRRRRFFIFSDPLHDEYEQTALWYPSPRRAFDAIRDHILEAGLVRHLEADTSLFRVRRSTGRPLTDPADFDPPPPNVVQVNRMNAPGISAGYYSLDQETALRETALRPGLYFVAEFRLLRNIVVVDFTSLKAIPSLFNEAAMPTSRIAARFLHDLAEEISQPVPRDDRVMLSYLSTQLLGEFFTLEVKDSDGVPSSGVIWRSSQNDGRSLVLYGGEELRTGKDPHSYWRNGESGYTVEPLLAMVGTPQAIYRDGEGKERGILGELQRVRASVAGVRNTIKDTFYSLVTSRLQYFNSR